MGEFDSGKYATRWGAARALRKLVDAAGLQVLRLTNGTVALLPPQDAELFLAAVSSAKQEAALKEFNGQRDELRKQSAANVLSNLWRAGFLADSIKKELLEAHYHLVLEQSPFAETISGWRVQCEPTFPFPDVFAEYTPTLYVNNQVKWAPARSQLTIAMTVPVKGAAHSIANMGGGWPGLADNFGITPGVVLRCKIDFKQTIHGHSWQASLWSNEITFRGFNN